MTQKPKNKMNINNKMTYDIATYLSIIVIVFFFCIIFLEKLYMIIYKYTVLHPNFVCWIENLMVDREPNVG